MAFGISRIALVAAAASIWPSQAGAQATPKAPNVVVVLVDDLRWDDIGASGHPFVETPNIDRIAREGARFLNAFATTPLCSPSRASILTGQYVHTNGIIDNTGRSALSHRLDTFPRPLQQAGYETAFIGKWHMGNDNTPRPGFSHWAAMRGQGEAIDPLLNVDGKPTQTKGYVTDILTDYAIRFMERSKGKPFMVFLAHKALHPNIIQRDDGSSERIEGQPTGFVAAERHRGRYANKAIPRRPNALKAPVKKPALLRPIGNLPPLSPETGTEDTEVRQRLEMLLGVDDGLGRMVESLTKLGELENTVVIFTSDHGYFYGEHGLGGERRLAYEETARIPLLIRFPRLARAGSTPEQLVMSIDLAPTILELAGAAPQAKLHGHSLVPLLSGRSQGWRSSILIEYFSDTVFPRIRDMAYQAVRTDRHKYIDYTQLEGADELYDLQTDPYEMDNIIDSPGARDILQRMQVELAKLQAASDFQPTSGRGAGPPAKR